MKTQRFSLIYVIGISILMLLVFLLAMMVVLLRIQPKSRVSCMDFSSYDDAKRALAGGAYWLDKDSDGRPCQAKFPKEAKADSDYGE